MLRNFLERLAILFISLALVGLIAYLSYLRIFNPHTWNYDLGVASHLAQIVGIIAAILVLLILAWHIRLVPALVKITMSILDGYHNHKDRTQQRMIAERKARKELQAMHENTQLIQSQIVRNQAEARLKEAEVYATIRRVQIEEQNALAQNFRETQEAEIITVSSAERLFLRRGSEIVQIADSVPSDSSSSHGRYVPERATSRGTERGTEAEESNDDLPLTVPTIAELLLNEQISPLSPNFVLGVPSREVEKARYIGLDITLPQMGVPYTAEWNGKLGMYICGLPGTGKSQAVSVFTSIDVLHGARLLIVDPEPDTAQSITSRLQPFSRYFLAPVGDSPRGVKRVVEAAMEELEHANPHYSVVFICEELPTLVRNELEKVTGWESLGLVRCIEEYARRGRKLRRKVVGITQVSQASRAGNAIIRATLPNRLLFRVVPEQGKLLGLTTKDQQMLASLPNYHALVTWDDLTVLTQMGIPLITSEDMKEIIHLRETYIEGTIDYTEEFFREDKRASHNPSYGSKSGSLGESKSGSLPSNVVRHSQFLGAKANRYRSQVLTTGSLEPALNQSRTTSEPALNHDQTMMVQYGLPSHDGSLQVRIQKIQALRKSKNGCSLRRACAEVYKIPYGGVGEKFRAAREEYLKIVQYLDALEQGNEQAEGAY